MSTPKRAEATAFYSSKVATGAPRTRSRSSQVAGVGTSTPTPQLQRRAVFRLHERPSRHALGRDRSPNGLRRGAGVATMRLLPQPTRSKPDEGLMAGGQTLAPRRSSSFAPSARDPQPTAAGQGVEGMVLREGPARAPGKPPPSEARVALGTRTRSTAAPQSGTLIGRGSSTWPRPWCTLVLSLILFGRGAIGDPDVQSSATAIRHPSCGRSCGGRTRSWKG